MRCRQIVAPLTGHLANSGEAQIPIARALPEPHSSVPRFRPWRFIQRLPAGARASSTLVAKGRRRTNLNLCGRWGGAAATSAIWRTADFAAFECPNVRFAALPEYEQAAGKRTDVFAPWRSPASLPSTYEDSSTPSRGHLRFRRSRYMTYCARGRFCQNPLMASSSFSRASSRFSWLGMESRLHDSTGSYSLFS
jgi:hypothetical protein